VTNRRRLIVMRHAKAEPFAATDHERCLTDAGRKTATAAGRHLAETGAVPDHVVLSSALRATQTWEAVAEASGATVAPVLDDAVYNGSVDVLLEALRVVPQESATVLFVGHNPSASYLAHLVDDGDGDPDATQRMLEGFAPGALAVLTLDVPWEELGPETGRLEDFHVGGPA
jgi:phosphohistidine phosphatase